MLATKLEVMELELFDTTTERVFVDRVNTINENLFVWTIIDGVLVVCILAGNILTILAVRYHRRLRLLISNLFVLSLALSDIFVGLTLPYHLAFYMGNELGRQKHWCLLRFFVLIIACSVSIWNLIAIAVDRYIAICYPLHYTRIMTKKVALVILGFGWCLAIMVATVPLIWNRWDTAMECEFDELLYPWYVAGVITPIFSLVWLCLLLVYWRIWREAAKHAKQLRTHHSQVGTSDWKSVQVVLLIMGCFTFCWLPYFVVILTQIFNFFDYNSPVLYKAAFSLAMANSMMNPVIYAWKNTNFRDAFKQLLTCRKLDQLDGPQTATGLKSRSLKKRDSSRSYHASGNTSSRNHPVNQDSVESIAAQVSEHEITFISTLNDSDSFKNHTIQLSVGTTNRGSGTNGPTSITTHIIKGNVIINNYNLYESILNVGNQNDGINGVRNFNRTSTHGTEPNGNCAKDGNQWNHNCDMKEGEGISNPSFSEDITRL